MSEYETRWVEVSELVGDEKNPRTHDRRNIDAIKSSLNKHGQVQPLLIQKSTGMVIAGNGRLQAIRELGINAALCAYIDVSDKEARELSIKLNRTAELAGWDNEVLSFHLDQLEGLSDDWSVDDFGFTGDEFKQLSLDESDLKKRRLTAKELRQIPDETISLNAQFGVPPFSLLDTRKGYWQNKKRAWFSTGLRTTSGRDQLLTTCNTSEGKYRYFSHRGGVNANRGGSSFDPVLAELLSRWFMPKHGHILDPFAGEATKGCVFGVLGYRYTGVDVRAEQVEANELHWKQIKDRVYIGEPEDFDPFTIPGEGSPDKDAPKNGNSITIVHGAVGDITLQACEIFNGVTKKPLRSSWEGSALPAQAVRCPH